MGQFPNWDHRQVVKYSVDRTKGLTWSGNTLYVGSLGQAQPDGQGNLAAWREWAVVGFEPSHILYLGGDKLVARSGDTELWASTNMGKSWSLIAPPASGWSWIMNPGLVRVGDGKFAFVGFMGNDDQGYFVGMIGEDGYSVTMTAHTTEYVGIVSPVAPAHGGRLLSQCEGLPGDAIERAIYTFKWCEVLTVTGPSDINDISAPSGEWQVEEYPVSIYSTAVGFKRNPYWSGTGYDGFWGGYWDCPYRREVSPGIYETHLNVLASSGIIMDLPAEPLREKAAPATDWDWGGLLTPANLYSGSGAVEVTLGVTTEFETEYIPADESHTGEDEYWHTLPSAIVTGMWTWDRPIPVGGNLSTMIATVSSLDGMRVGDIGIYVVSDDGGDSYSSVGTGGFPRFKYGFCTDQSTFLVDDDPETGNPRLIKSSNLSTWSTIVEDVDAFFSYHDTNAAELGNGVALMIGFGQEFLRLTNHGGDHATIAADVDFLGSVSAAKKITETSNGKVVAPVYDPATGKYRVAISTDQGLTWQLGQELPGTNPIVLLKEVA